MDLQSLYAEACLADASPWRISDDGARLLWAADVGIVTLGAACASLIFVTPWPFALAVVYAVLRFAALGLAGAMDQDARILGLDFWQVCTAGWLTAPFLAWYPRVRQRYQARCFRRTFDPLRSDQILRIIVYLEGRDRSRCKAALRRIDTWRQEAETDLSKAEERLALMREQAAPEPSGLTLEQLEACRNAHKSRIERYHALEAECMGAREPRARLAEQLRREHIRRSMARPIEGIQAPDDPEHRRELVERQVEGYVQGGLEFQASLESLLAEAEACRSCGGSAATKTPAL